MNHIKNAQAKVTKIENQIKERLIELCRQHPDAEVSRVASLNKRPTLYAKDVLNTGNLNTEGMLTIINSIEEWLAAQHPHKQTEIEFKDSAILIPVEKEYPDFIEYEDNGDNYQYPERTDEAQVLEIRLYCMHEGCNKYIKGHEGYNGMFRAETGQGCDLRNQGFNCKEHQKENE